MSRIIRAVNRITEAECLNEIGDKEKGQVLRNYIKGTTPQLLPLQRKKGTAQNRMRFPSKPGYPSQETYKADFDDASNN